MNRSFWEHLKSGTDIRGVAVAGVPGEELELTDEVTERIAAAFLFWLGENKGVKNPLIAVGHDSRISAERMKNAVIKALTEGGARVLDCSLASTPAMFMTTVDSGCDASVQITASHHPYHRNGLKFFLPSGGLEGADISEILAYAADNCSVEACEKGSVQSENYMEKYSARLRRMIEEGLGAEAGSKPLKGCRIAVDAGNGVGGFYAKDVLEPLGADISGSRYLEPDGMFPNHIPNPENAEAMDSIREAVLESGAELGVIFDTDVDRAGCVYFNGDEINRNRLVALAAAIALENNSGGTVVTDSVTSSGLNEFIEGTLGGVHCRFKRGYKNVINEAIRLNNEGVNAPLAIETSGHAALRENYFLDDGAYLVTKIIIKLVQLGREGMSLFALTSELKEPAESAEIRMKITETDFKKTGSEVIEALEKYAESRENWLLADDSREGVRVSFGEDDGNGWFLLRLSVHDPIMPLNIESNEAGEVKKIAAALLEFMKTVGGVDISPLENYVDDSVN